MRARCTNSNTKYWKWYGGLGVKVCPQWEDFAVFLADMGAAPTLKHSLDRWPDPAGNYEPGNVRWATRKEQQTNKRAKS
jgi:hypothetical protein